jgi:hydroxymethylbilane synthase
LAVLDGSCRTPIAALAVFEGDKLSFRGLIVKPDGSTLYETSRAGSAFEAEAMGRSAGEELLGRAGSGFFDFKS